MKARGLTTLVLVLLLAACGRDEPPKPQEKTYGGKLGDAYKGMLDDARHSVGELNEQMQRTDQAVRDRLR